MTEKNFLYQLRRGLGSAIIELKQNPERHKYKDIVLRCCLKDMAYDLQCEGTKGYYLYTAICALGCQNEFLKHITSAYLERVPYQLFQQLTDILKEYVRNGSSEAAAALRSKYAQLAEQLKHSRSFPFRLCEREQFEEMMIVSIDFGNWKSFRQAIEDAGAIMLVRKDDLCSSYDWFLDCAESRFGKVRVWKYLNENSAASVNVYVFIREHKRFEEMRKNYQASLVPITLKSLIEEAQTQPLDSRVYQRTGHCLQFARKASSEDLINLARFIEAERIACIQERLLRVFRRVDYPLNIEFLLTLVSSSDSALRETALSALARLKDVRIHRLAIEFLETGDAENGLPLLKMNWKKDDDLLIHRLITSSKHVSHAMQMDLRDIYMHNKSGYSGDILNHIYKHGECSLCRMYIVKAMGKQGVLTDKLALECQYDSYDKTRQYAKRLIKRRLEA